MPTILVTGAATHVGGWLIQRLERRRGTSVVAVDEFEPTVRFTSRIERLDPDGLELANLVLDVAPDAVVHLQTDQGEDGNDSPVLRAQALFGAIGRSDSVRHVVVRSDGAIYGSGPRSPSVVDVDTAPDAGSGRYQRELIELERFVDGMAAAHRSVRYTVLRFAPVFGPNVRNPISRYLTLPGVPTQLGFDPRLQLVAEQDAVAAFAHALDHPVEGTFNVAGTGQLYLSRVLRLGLRVPQPLPKRAFRRAMKGLASAGLELPDHLVALLKYGRVMDTTRTESLLGFTPRLGSRDAVRAGYRRLPEFAA